MLAPPQDCELHALTTRDVQVIPHNFGRQRPPIIRSHKMVEDKIRMCDVLSDIEVAQDLLEPKPDEEEQQVELQPHPADEKYATLQADLSVIPPGKEEYNIVRKFAEVPLNSRQLHLQHLCSCPVVHSKVLHNDSAATHMPHAWCVSAAESGLQRSVAHPT